MRSLPPPSRLPQRSVDARNRLRCRVSAPELPASLQAELDELEASQHCGDAGVYFFFCVGDAIHTRLCVCGVERTMNAHAHRDAYSHCS